MLFSQAQSYLADMVDKSTSDSDTLRKIKDSLNFAKITVGKSAFWKQLTVNDNELVIVPNYETGTASVSNGSRTVTISGGTVATNFKGRFFYLKDSGGYHYKIIDVNTSGNTLTLNSIFLGDTASNLNYSIYKKWYRVPSDILTVIPNIEIDDNPIVIEPEGYDENSTVYSTGSISLTKDSNMLTGTGTAFLDNVYPGDMIVVGSIIYRILNVISDTSIKMVNKAIDDYSGSYSIESENPYIAQVISPDINLNSTNYSLLKYRYIRHLYSMLNDNDTTELPSIFDECILGYAESRFLKLSKNIEWQSTLAIAKSRLDKLKLDKDLAYFAAPIFKQQKSASMPGRQ